MRFLTPRTISWNLIRFTPVFVCPCCPRYLAQHALLTFVFNLVVVASFTSERKWNVNDELDRNLWLSGAMAAWEHPGQNVVSPRRRWWVVQFRNTINFVTVCAKTFDGLCMHHLMQTNVPDERVLPS